jgi:RimJ/RimL family protein N-acetyltransferase
MERYVTGWREHGLDVWVARQRSSDGAGALVGMGGCSLRDDRAWNLYYRLEPHAQGRGYAQELITAARAAAAETRPELPVVAYLLEHNTGSRRAAERAGLELVWRGPDAGNPDRSAVRLVYADRQLNPETLAAFTDH